MKTITLYHGTDRDTARRIWREGLKPDVHKWLLDDGSGTSVADDDAPGFVYVTRSPEWAKRFAKLRADYWRAERGEFLRFGLQALRKRTSKRRPTARPAIVKIELPAYWPHDYDPKCLTCGAYRIPGEIPAQYVTALVSAFTGRKLKTPPRRSQDNSTTQEGTDHARPRNNSALVA